MILSNDVIIVVDGLKTTFIYLLFSWCLQGRGSNLEWQEYYSSNAEEIAVPDFHYTSVTT